jgi:hypothetical protein
MRLIVAWTSHSSRRYTAGRIDWLEWADSGERVAEALWCHRQRRRYTEKKIKKAEKALEDKVGATLPVTRW